jgi:hypothetical protein
MRRTIALIATLLLSVSLMGQDNRLLHWGIDTTVDCFDLSSASIRPSIGLGVRSRLGGRDRLFNLVGGIRYIHGARLSGFQVPILLNANLVRGRQYSAYFGAGYEFDFIGTYWGAVKFQAGLAGRRYDLRVFYKPYQGDLGIGLTRYF